MPVTEFVCYNGNFIKKADPVFNSENRAFRYGDGLFETIRVSEKKIFFFPDHWQRLTSGMKILEFEENNDFSYGSVGIYIIKLLNINRLFQGARIKLSVFRSGGGFYTPLNNRFDYLIEAGPLNEIDYSLNSKGLIIDFYEKHKKPTGFISEMKTSNSLFYVLASKWKNENKLDDCFILNELDNVVEASSSNIFLVKDNILITPSLNDGCINGIIRNRIISIALNKDYIVYDDANIKETDIIDADEVFITNAISGINWVVACRHKRYYNKTSVSLIDLLKREAIANSYQDE
jgi:branched-chain amino acid aminotransferase